MYNLNFCSLLSIVLRSIFCFICISFCFCNCYLSSTGNKNTILQGLIWQLRSCVLLTHHLLGKAKTQLDTLYGPRVKATKTIPYNKLPPPPPPPNRTNNRLLGLSAYLLAGGSAGLPKLFPGPGHPQKHSSA